MIQRPDNGSTIEGDGLFLGNIVLEISDEDESILTAHRLVRRLEDGEFTEIKKSIKYVVDASRSFDYLRMADEEFNRIRMLFLDISTIKSYAEVNSYGIFQNIKKSMASYFMFCRCYTDGAEFRAKRADTRTFDSVKKLLSKAYDDNFSYRFLSHLRNYVQHTELPISRAHGVYENNGKIEYGVFVSIDYLLSSFDWKTKLRLELESRIGQEMDLLPLMREHIDILLKTGDEIRFIEYPDLESHVLNVANYLAEAYRDDGTPIIINQVFRNENSGVTANIQEFPLNELENFGVSKENVKWLSEKKRSGV